MSIALALAHHIVAMRDDDLPVDALAWSRVGLLDTIGVGPFDAGTIARVESWTSAQRLAHTNRPHPQSALDAKFSVQYCVARVLPPARIRALSAAIERFDEFASIRQFTALIETTEPVGAGIRGR